ncbi:uncharacterized protein A4U43_C01F12540 [Asparagus officinalis]|uniref:Uncharacterized protein n=1 Tax=Asparagus officinalis TaxID=4686 RepID=A0A5P1FNV5_ASPOF|nr:uncharacterized protein A4U43_C01F12540 [Asparagus officinalis]
MDPPPPPPPPPPAPPSSTCPLQVVATHRAPTQIDAMVSSLRGPNLPKPRTYLTAAPILRLRSARASSSGFTHLLHSATPPQPDLASTPPTPITSPPSILRPPHLRRHHGRTIGSRRRRRPRLGHTSMCAWIVIEVNPCEIRRGGGDAEVLRRFRRQNERAGQNEADEFWGELLAGQGKRVYGGLYFGV